MQQARAGFDVLEEIGDGAQVGQRRDAIEAEAGDGLAGGERGGGGGAG